MDEIKQDTYHGVLVVTYDLPPDPKLDEIAFVLEVD
jgi:hypothetical protein